MTVPYVLSPEGTLTAHTATGWDTYRVKKKTKKGAENEPGWCALCPAVAGVRLREPLGARAQ